MVTMLLTHDCIMIKWSQPEYLQDHNPNYRQKIIPNILKNDRLVVIGLCRVVMGYTFSLDTLEGYPGINTKLGYPEISLVKLQQTRISHDNLGQPSKTCTN